MQGLVGNLGAGSVGQSLHLSGDCLICEIQVNTKREIPLESLQVTAVDLGIMSSRHVGSVIVATIRVD